VRADRYGGALGLEPTRLIARLLINMLALLVAAKLVDGITLSGWQAAVLAGAIFGLVNAFIKPAVRFLTCPLYLLTLGLFALVVNALMLLLTSALAGALHIGFHVDGFGAALFGGIVIALVSWIASLLL
jgi:putative membrane protein